MKDFIRNRWVGKVWIHSSFFGADSHDWLLECDFPLHHGLRFRPCVLCKVVFFFDSEGGVYIYNIYRIG